jgi:hypothetical protein
MRECGAVSVSHAIHYRMGKFRQGMIWSTTETVDSIFLLGLADSLFQTAATVAWGWLTVFPDSSD